MRSRAQTPLCLRQQDASHCIC